MSINEIFPNPVVKEVAFEVRFPNLFFLESRIGNFQTKVMKDFPESALLLRKHVLLAEGEQENLQSALANVAKDEAVTKVWQFKSPKGITLNVTGGSLSLSSSSHKSYLLGGSERFRNVIEMVTGHFLDLTELPLFNRVGLRYIDDCPIPARTTEVLLSHYDTAFPTRRFPLESAIGMDFAAVVERNGCQMRYMESYSATSDKLRLDFDAWSENVDARALMEETDRLHGVIRSEFERVIRGPVLEYMRTKTSATETDK